MIRLIFKKVLPFLLIISLLPSCNSKENDQAAALQYQVSEFAGEAGFAEPVKMVMDYSKNRIIVIDNRSGNGNGSDNSSDISSDNGSHDGNGNGNSSSNSSGKGNSFPTLVYLDSSGKPTTEVMLPVNGDCSVIAMDLDNNVNILEQEVIEDSSGSPKETRLKVHTYDYSGKHVGTIELGAVPAVDGKPYRARDMALNIKGDIFLLKWNDRVDIYDSEGKSKGSISTYRYTCMDIDHEGNLILGGNSGANGNPFMEKINTLTMESKWTVELDKAPLIIRHNKNANYIVVMNQDEIKKHDFYGRLKDTLLDFNRNPVSNVYEIRDLCTDYSHAVYLIVPGSKSIRKYTPSDSGGEPKEKTVLTLASFRGDSILFHRFAMERFSALYPDVEIKIKSYDKRQIQLDMDIDQRRKAVEAQKKVFNEAIKELYTELMAGKGPDIIDLGYSKLQYKKLVDKNILVNLSELISKDETFDINTLFPNVIEACKYKGSLYAMPTGITFDIMTADKLVLDEENIIIDDKSWTWEDFLDICRKVKKDLDGDGIPDRYGLYDMTYTEMFDMIFKGCYNQFMDASNKTARFDTQEFIELLNTCKAFYEEQHMNPRVNRRYLFDMGAHGAIAFLPFEVNSYISTYVVKRWFESVNAEFFLYPSNQENREIVFNMEVALAINRNCKHVEEAWEFIKITASEEVQSSIDFQRGFPVNRKAEENHIKWIYDHNEEVKKINDPIYIHKEEEINRMHYLVENCNKLSDFDPLVHAIVEQEVLPFFEGRRTAQEAAEIIQDKVMTYLNE